MVWEELPKYPRCPARLNAIRAILQDIGEPVIMSIDTGLADHKSSAVTIASAGIQLRVIGALIMRELHTRYGRENIGFAWFIGEPIVFALGVTILWSQTRGASEHGISVIVFVLTGYAPLTMWRHCFAQSVNALKSNGSLLYHKQVTFLDLVVARCAIEICGSMLAFVLSIALFWCILGLVGPPQGSILLFLCGWLLAAWFSFATAVLVAPVTELSHAAEKLASVVGYIQIPLCGAFWMVDWLPPWVQPYVLWIPTVNGYELIRAGYFGDQVKSYYDPWQACLVCAAMTVMGLGLFRRARNHLTVE